MTMLAMARKSEFEGNGILWTMLLCFRQCRVSNTYPCSDAWRHSAIVVPHKYLVPHRYCFGNHFGDSGIKAIVLIGVQVVDIRGEIDIEALSLELDFSR